MTLWTAILTCPDCGQEINRAEHVPDRERAKVSLSAAFMLCPVREHNTLSDLNLRGVLTWTEEKSGGE